MDKIFTLWGELKLDDSHYRAGLAAAQAGLEGFTAKQTTAESKVRSFGSSAITAGAQLSRVGRDLTVGFTLPLIGAGVAATKWATDFQQDMVRIKTQAGDTTDSIADLSKQVLQLARSSQFDPATLSEGLYHLASLGLRGAEAMNALNISQKMAAVGGADLEKTASALGAAWVTQIRGTEDLSQAAGTLNAIVGQGNMRMGDLISAMGTGVLPVFKNAGLSLTDFGAALATLTDSGMGAAASATRLRMMIAMLIAPSQKAQDQLEAIGLTSEKLGVEMREKGLIPALRDLKDHLEKTFGSSDTGMVKMEAALTRIFGGGRNSAGVQTLLGQLDRMDQKFQQIGAQSGKFESDAAEQSQTAAAKIATAWSTIQAVGIELGQKVLPLVADALSAAAKGLDDVWEWFQKLSPQWQLFIEIATGVASALGPVILAIGSLVSFAGAVITGTTAILGMVAAAGGLSTIAPIVAAVVAAFALAIAEGYALYQAWQTDFGGIRSYLTESFNYMVALVKTSLNTIKELWATHGSGITALARDSWTMIKDNIDAVLLVITGTLRVGMAVIHGDWEKAWQIVLETIRRIGADIGQSGSAMMSVLRKYLEDFIPWVVSWGVRLAIALNTAISSAIAKVVSLFVTLPAQLVTIVPAMVRAGSQIGAALWQGIKQGLTAAGQVSGGLGGSFGSGLLAGQLGGNIGGGIIDPFLGLGDNLKGGAGVGGGGGGRGQGSSNSAASDYARSEYQANVTLAQDSLRDTQDRFREFLQSSIEGLKSWEGISNKSLRTVTDAFIRYQDNINASAQALKALEDQQRATMTPTEGALLTSNQNRRMQDLAQSLKEMRDSFVEKAKAAKDSLEAGYQKAVSNFGHRAEGEGNGFADYIKAQAEESKEAWNDFYQQAGTPPPLDRWQFFWRNLTDKIDEMKAKLPSLKQSLGENLLGSFDQISGMFGNAVANWNGSFKSLFTSVAKNFAQMAAQIAGEMIKLLILKSLLNLFGGALGGGSSGGGVWSSGGSMGNWGDPTGWGFADGGLVGGGGSSRSDSVFARLSRGEFVMSAGAVQMFGASNLNAMNSGQMPGFGGGPVIHNHFHADPQTGAFNRMSATQAARDMSEFQRRALTK